MKAYDRFRSAYKTKLVTTHLSECTCRARSHSEGNYVQLSLFRGDDHFVVRMTAAEADTLATELRRASTHIHMHLQKGNMG